MNDHQSMESKISTPTGSARLLSRRPPKKRATVAQLVRSAGGKVIAATRKGRSKAISGSKPEMAAQPANLLVWNQTSRRYFLRIGYSEGGKEMPTQTLDVHPIVMQPFLRALVTLQASAATVLGPAIVAAMQDAIAAAEADEPGSTIRVNKPGSAKRRRAEATKGGAK